MAQETHVPVIIFDASGYPTEESLEKLEQDLQEAWDQNDWEKAAMLFYTALRANIYGDKYCGPGKVEVCGEMIDVWEYHTGGWSGHESILAVLKRSPFWHLWLNRYDRGGHYYFEPPEKIMAVFRRRKGS